MCPIMALIRTETYSTLLYSIKVLRLTVYVFLYSNYNKHNRMIPNKNVIRAAG